MKQVKGIWLPDSDTHFEKLIDYQGNYQRKQFDTALKYIKPEDRGLFIDVGAHVGLWSRMAIKASFKNILAFEPDRENFECLNSNLVSELEPNKCFGIIFDAALTESINDNLIVENEKIDNSGAKKVVQTSNGCCKSFVFDKLFTEDRLDFYAKESNILIKIDVQGYEAKIIRGMTNFIKEYKPIIIVEQWLDGKEDLEATRYCELLGMKILEKVKKEVILGW